MGFDFSNLHRQRVKRAADCLTVLPMKEMKALLNEVDFTNFKTEVDRAKEYYKGFPDLSDDARQYLGPMSLANNALLVVSRYEKSLAKQRKLISNKQRDKLRALEKAAALLSEKALEDFPAYVPEAEHYLFHISTPTDPFGVERGLYGTSEFQHPLRKTKVELEVGSMDALLLAFQRYALERAANRLDPEYVNPAPVQPSWDRLRMVQRLTRI
jgi:hypothetical protein